jgi:hypothetical protein
MDDLVVHDSFKNGIDNPWDLFYNTCQVKLL